MSTTATIDDLKSIPSLAATIGRSTADVLGAIGALALRPTYRIDGRPYLGSEEQRLVADWLAVQDTPAGG